jgi:putative transposase
MDTERMSASPKGDTMKHLLPASQTEFNGTPKPTTLMSDAQFINWANQRGLTEMAKQTISNIRTAPPSRLVGTTRRQSNVSGTFPSRKMGLKLQFESRTIEWPFLYLADNDPSVLEIYDQPPAFKIGYINNGKPVSHLYTADFFLLKKESAGWVELKTTADLQELSAKWPERYVYTEGKWKCPPAEAHAARFGLTFTILTEHDLPKTLIRNYSFLNSYYSAQSTLNQGKLELITADVAKAPGVTIDQLLAENKSIAIDDLYLAIAQYSIYCDLGHEFLGRHDAVHLFVSKVVGDAYLKTVASQYSSTPRPPALVLAPGGAITVFKKSYQILDLTSKQAKCVSSDGKIVTFEIAELIRLGPENVGYTVDTRPDEITALLSSVRERDLKSANERYDILKTGSDQVHRVTLCTYARKYREAEVRYGSGFLGLISKDSSKGNRVPRYPEATRALAQNIIKEKYRPRIGRSIKLTYGMFRNACAANQIVDIPSQAWFVDQINRHQKPNLVCEREGHRVAYQHEAALDTTGEVIPKHGDFPWHVAHIDHTVGDVELLSGETGQNLGRPWITLMICAYSRKVLAMVVTYDPPSYRSCLLLIQECLKVHNRLPEIIVIDNGSEFESIYFTSILNLFKVTRLDRPPSKPRFGAIIESMFGKINEDFIHNLPGNTKATKNVRQMTKSTDPKGLAELTLAQFHRRLEGYLGLYHSQPHSNLGTSPEDHYNRGLVRFGHRAHTMFPYSESIRILTLATTDTGTATVRKGNVRINYIDYTCTKLKDSRYWGKLVPVRYDPWDISVAYAFLDGLWRLCSCGYHSQFRGRSEKQIALASREIRQGKVLHSKSRNVSAAQLAAFFESCDSDQLALQEDQDRELTTLIQGELVDDKPTAETKQSLPTVSTTALPKVGPVDGADGDDDNQPIFKSYTI